jgi:hypothetical protein
MRPRTNNRSNPTSTVRGSNFEGEQESSVIGSAGVEEFSSSRQQGESGRLQR